MSTRRRLALGAAFALLLGLSFPFRAGQLAFDLGAVTGWLALVPLALACRELGPRAAFRFGIVASWAGYALSLFWLYVVVRVHGGAPAIGGVGAVLAVTLVFALHAGAAASLTSWLAPKLGRAGVLVLPAAWVIGEELRGFDVLGGFPWSYVGYAFHLDPPMRALAPWLGVFGLGFVAVLVANLLAEGRWRVALLIVALAHGVGLARDFQVQRELAAAPQAKPLRVALIQGNIPQGEKWDPQLSERNFQVHLDLSREAAKDHPDLILWPEAAIPGSFEYQHEYYDPLIALVKELNVPMVVGGIGLAPIEGQRRFRYYNSVFVLTPEQGFVERYDKSVLVPFGEYVPLRSVFGFLSAVATTLANMEDITPGSAPRPLHGLTGLAPRYVPVALICYEAVYPELVRETALEGANLLLNLTNDAWYGFSSGPDQFLAIAAMRSAELGLPMMRAANTGVSAVIDARGEVVTRTALFERTQLVVPVPPRLSAPTWFTRWGDWPIPASWAFLVASVGVVLVRRRER